MNELFEKISKLAAVPTVSGCEDEAYEFIKNEIGSFCDEVTKDAMGNVIAVKKCGRDGAKKVVLEANIDETGFVSTYIDENGRIKLHGIGKRGFCRLSGRDALANNEKCGILLSEKAQPDTGDFVLDIGADSREESEEYISQGDFIGVKREPKRIGDKRISLDGMSGKALCVCLLDIAKLSMLLCFDLYFVFSAQKHTVNRGAVSAANRISPDIAICLELVPSECGKVGGGAVILSRTNGAVSSPELSDKLKYALDSIGAKRNVSSKTFGGDQSSLVHFLSAGALGASVGVPCDSYENGAEITDMQDIKAAEALLCAFLIFEDEEENKENNENVQ